MIRVKSNIRYGIGVLPSWAIPRWGCVAVCGLSGSGCTGGADHSPGAGDSASGSSSVLLTGGSPSATGSGGSPAAGGASAASGGADEPAASGGGLSVIPPGSGGSEGSAGGAGGLRDPGAGGAPPVPPEPPDLEHTFEPITIAPGEEVTGTCQSWTLNNDAPVFVNRVVASNQGAFHHSNWIWVRDTDYPGPDGTWPCADRGFDQILAGAVGGVFFAQSTQAKTDTQAFPEGVAFELPAHARIIGDVHLLNTTPDSMTTTLSFEVYGIEASTVRVPLQPMAFTNTALELAPLMRTRARMQCATPVPDFDVYYVLPHYHQLGVGMQITVAGGPMDGSLLFESDVPYGEPAGRTYDPPLSITGALGLGITCEYDNPRAEPVRYGVGDQEMCVTLIYSSGRKAGGMAVSNLTVQDEGGVRRTDALCIAVGG